MMKKTLILMMLCQTYRLLELPWALGRKQEARLALDQNHAHNQLRQCARVCYMLNIIWI